MAMINIATLIYAKMNTKQLMSNIQMLPCIGTPTNSNSRINITAAIVVINVSVGVSLPIRAVVIEPRAVLIHSSAVDYFSSEPMAKMVDNTVKMSIIIGRKLGRR